jgi:putative ABC transport system permease protein
MSLLDLKLLRDLRAWLGQVAAIGAVAACGITAFVTMQTNYDAMHDAKATYYSNYYFGDLFASITRAPNDVAERLAALPHVDRVQTRVVQDVLADIPGRSDPATLRLIGIPDGRQPVLDQVYIRRGRLPSAVARNEALVSEAFAQSNGIDIGVQVPVLLNGRRVILHVVGVGLSPEYVYEMRGGADIWPDSRHFGIAWLNETALAAAFDLTDSFNDVALSVAPGADQRAIIEQVDSILGRYGSLGAYDRRDQMSDRFVSNELAQLRAQAVFIPLIFLGIAAFLIHVSLSRLVVTQREQVALLKAFGYDNATVAIHYAKAALIMIGLGAVVGVFSGWWLGYRLAVLYTKFFRFPEVVFHLRIGTVVLCVVISLLAGIAGAALAVRSVVRLPPAVAMRPPSPSSFRPSFLERLGLTGFFSAPFRMIVRSIERKPIPAIITVIALTFAVAILLVGRSTVDAVNRMMDVQFNYVSREDATVTFVRPLSSRARLSLSALPGVLESEPFRVAFARASNGHVSRRLAIIGLPEGPDLHHVIDRNLSEMRPPPSGVLITEALARILDVSPGSVITISFLEGARRTVSEPVRAVVDELVGLNIYMNENQLNALLREDASSSGAYVRLDPKSETAFDTAAKSTPKISGVAYRRSALEEFQRSFAESIGISAAFILGFAFVIAFGVVYNAGRVTLSERARELCTLRILGYSVSSVAMILIGEQLLLTAVAIPFGLLVGLGLDRALQPLYELEYYRVPIVVSNETYLFAIAFTLFAVMISSWAIGSGVRKLDVVTALKAGE